MKRGIVVFLFATSFHVTFQYFDRGKCDYDLGMQSYKIKDKDITASSSFDLGNVGPQAARLNQDVLGGAWCPRNQSSSETSEWLEINLHKTHVITSIATQGRFGNGNGKEYAEAYKVEYFRPKLGKWVEYKDINGTQIIPGNENTYLEAWGIIDPPIFADRIRILPYSSQPRTTCMRVELFGCVWDEGIVSYTMPQGDERNTDWQFLDEIYDGIWGNVFQGGLGLLTDGKVGSDDIHIGPSTGQRNDQWVGWKNETHDSNPIRMVFQFDRLREFSAVTIYACNQINYEIQVFSMAEIYFSIDGSTFSDSVSYKHTEDVTSGSSRNVTIKLYRRIGRFVKIVLYFSNRWMLISEVYFENVPAKGKFILETFPYNEIMSVKDSTVATEIPLYNTAANPETTAVSHIYDQKVFMTIVIIGLMVIILILGSGIMYFIIQQRKKNESPVAAKVILTSHIPGSTVSGSSCSGTITYNGRNIATTASSSLGHRHLNPRDTTLIMNRQIKVNDYQEPFQGPYQEPHHDPYQVYKYAPYYSYSSIAEMRNSLANCSNDSNDPTYDYAVPDMCTLPLTGIRPPSPAPAPPITFLPLDKNSTSSQKCYIRNDPPSPAPTSHKSFAPLIQKKNNNNLLKEHNMKSHPLSDSPSPCGPLPPRAFVPIGDNHVVTSNKLSGNNRNKQGISDIVSEFPRHKLKMVSQLGEGLYGSAYIAEANDVNDFGLKSGLEYVAVKCLPTNATQKEMKNFHRDVETLITLKDRNVARLIGVCSTEEPYCMVVEYLPQGDLNQFLKQHKSFETTKIDHLNASTNYLSVKCLLYMATQIASGMRYLETKNFAHRDLATRNCLVGEAYQIKISDLGSYSEKYLPDYYLMRGCVIQPIRWIACELLQESDPTIKSDVWSFGVTLWEILTMARERPYKELDDLQVLENLAHLNNNDGLFKPLSRPYCSKDILDLMNECWRRNKQERPSFREIHLFLQRKTLGYHPKDLE